MNQPQPAPSILKSLALAALTLTLSTWALGSLWISSEATLPAMEPALAIASSAP